MDTFTEDQKQTIRDLIEEHFPIVLKKEIKELNERNAEELAKAEKTVEKEYCEECERPISDAYFYLEDEEESLGKFCGKECLMHYLISHN